MRGSQHASKAPLVPALSTSSPPPQVATDPCAPHAGSPVACAAVVDGARGVPICRYQARSQSRGIWGWRSGGRPAACVQCPVPAALPTPTCLPRSTPTPASALQSSCYDMCRDCSQCLGIVAALPARLAGLKGDTSKYAAAARDFCLQVRQGWERVTSGAGWEKGGTAWCKLGAPDPCVPPIPHCLPPPRPPTTPRRAAATRGPAGPPSTPWPRTPRPPPAPPPCARHCTSAGARRCGTGSRAVASYRGRRVATRCREPEGSMPP